MTTETVKFKLPEPVAGALPCPFCATLPVMLTGCVEETSAARYRLHCYGCNTRGGTHYSADVALSRWNTRERR